MNHRPPRNINLPTCQPCILLIFLLILFIPNAYAKDENQPRLKPAATMRIENQRLRPRQVGATTNVTENVKGEQLFIIKADEADYNEKKGYLVASGNVSLISGETITETNYIYYDLESEVLKINNPFIIKKVVNADMSSSEVRGDYLKGVSLNYDLKNEEGSADQVDSMIGGIFFKGESIKFSEKKITVLKAFFTNCPHTPKHYGMQARSLHIYSESGVVAIRGAVLRLVRIPIFYLPSYVYGRLREGAVSQTSIPEIGSDGVRGTYVREKIGYHFGKLFTGTFNLEWSKNLGWGTGLNNSFKFNDRFYGDFRLNYVVNSGWEEGFKNYFVLWQKRGGEDKTGVCPARDTENVTTGNAESVITKDAKEEKKSKGIFKNFFISFFPEVSKAEIKLSVEANNHELVNFQRISYRPQLELDLPGLTVPFLNTYVKASGGWGRIREESTITTSRSYLYCDLRQNLIPEKYLSLSLSVDYDHFWYGQGSFWKRFSGKVDIAKATKYLSLNAGYLRMFENVGSSPFNFDKYQAVENDEVYWGVRVGSASSMGINFYYDLGKKNYRYKEYNVTLALCKWRLKVAWEDVGKNIGFGLTLTH